MGGTFDPVHHGHLSAASEVATRFALDEVVFVPTGRPWQKSDQQVSSPEDRYLMTVIATASNPRFSVSRVDVDRPGPTYTIDTLRALHEQWGAAEMFFITGVSRPGFEPVDLSRFPEGAVTVLEVPALAISSTGCRARVASGDPVWYLVPDGVVQYIEKRALYRPAPA